MIKFKLFRFRETSPKKHKDSGIPQVAWKLPLVGHLFSLIKDGMNPVKTMARWHVKYGPRFMANIPGLGRILVTKDPDDIPRIAKRDLPVLTKRDDPPFPWNQVWNAHPERAVTYTWTNNQDYVNGIGVFRNALATPDIAIPRFGTHMMWNVNRMFQEFNHRFKPETGLVANLKELFFCFLIDPCVQMTCGKDLNFTTCDPKKLDSELSGFYDAVLNLGQNALKVAKNPINHLFKTKGYKTCEKYWQSLYGHSQIWYNELKAARKANDGRWPDVVSRDKSIFLDAYEDYFEKYLCNEKRLVCNIVEFVIGTADPGAQLIENILFQLAHHPEAQTAIYQEIVGVFEQDQAIDTLSLDQWRSLRLFQSFVAETCRYMPLFTIHMRRSVDNTVLADGTHIPDNTKVLVNYAGMSANEVNYPQADQFIPDRFLDLPDNKQPRCPFAAGKINNFNAVVPFGLGDRACPGIGWAQVITGMVVVSILRRYKVCYHGPLNIAYRHSTPNHPASPLDSYFRFQPRDQLKN